MLPDYPKIKEKLLKLYANQITENSEKSNLFKEIQKSILHEGDKVIIVREDGSTEESILKTEQVSIQIPEEYITQGNHEKINEILLEAAVEMEKKKTKSIYASLTDTANSIGNVINVNGMALNPDHIYELFEKIQLNFDKDDNNESGYKFYCHPNTVETLKEVFQIIESDPIQEQRFSELMARKKEQWRVRETNRKLVG
jgi:hypothetical protein